VFRAGLSGRAIYAPLRDVPGASITLPNGINDHGQVAGAYVDASLVPLPGGAAPPGSVHGFIRDPRGGITTFEVPYWAQDSYSYGEPQSSAVASIGFGT
jgi:hypothetical protein